MWVVQALRRVHDTLTQFSLWGFLPIVAWLDERREAVPCRQPALVHGDFHPNNILLREDGAAVVIDWAGLQVADARFDLAWTLVLAYAYESATMRDQVLYTYEQVSGQEVEQLASFEVLACLRRLLGVSISLLAGPEQFGMRPEAIAVMQQQIPIHRRVAELLAERTGNRFAYLESLWFDQSH